jgi:hypothetical protein
MLETLIGRLQLLQQQLGGKTHSAVAVNVGRPNTRTQVVSVVTSKSKGKGEPKAQDAELTPEELEQQAGEPLPERTQMSLIHTGPPGTGPYYELPIQPPEEV